MKCQLIPGRYTDCYRSHPVRGAWIEIQKFVAKCPESVSHPVRGAWIEIDGKRTVIRTGSQSHPVRGAWIEIPPMTASPSWAWSHPVRGAWIEIRRRLLRPSVRRLVAPREGCVD